MTDKSEAPTPRKLEEAREEGQVARSVELNTAAIMIISMMLLRGPGASLIETFQHSMVQAVTERPPAEITDIWLKQTGYAVAIQILPSLGLFIIGILVTGVAVTLGQTGFLWSTKHSVDFGRINPVSGFKRIFSSHGLIELLKALLKLTLVLYISYNYLRDNYTQFSLLNQTDFSTALGTLVEMVLSLGMRIGMTYFVLAAADYAYQRWSLMKKLKMSKQDIKDEIKRSEGDPYLKSRIRAQQRRMARGRMMANVPKSTVVVTNPTHLALAIQYGPDMNAPKLLAKGAHKTAERIVALARENNIPIVQNIPLARSIFKTIEVDQEITPELYMAMAEVLAYVYKITGKSTARRSAAPRPAAPQQHAGAHS